MRLTQNLLLDPRQLSSTYEVKDQRRDDSRGFVKIMNVQLIFCGSGRYDIRRREQDENPCIEGGGGLYLRFTGRSSRSIQHEWHWITVRWIWGFDQLCNALYSTIVECVIFWFWMCRYVWHSSVMASKSYDSEASCLLRPWIGGSERSLHPPWGWAPLLRKYTEKKEGTAV